MHPNVRPVESNKPIFLLCHLVFEISEEIGPVEDFLIIYYILFFKSLKMAKKQKKNKNKKKKIKSGKNDLQYLGKFE